MVQGHYLWFLVVHRWGIVVVLDGCRECWLIGADWHSWPSAAVLPAKVSLLGGTVVAPYGH